MSLLTIQDVKKFYGKQDVLRGAGFYIGPGERVGLIGGNGAGKTTLIRIILGEEAPDEGAVHRAKGLRLGYLPQDLMAFSGQTLLEMVMDTAENLREIETELKYVTADIEVAARRKDTDKALLTELTDRQGQLLSLFESLGGYTLEAEAKKILMGLGFKETDFLRGIDEFSGGWIMRAVLARLLLAGPDILLLDEPTNHLDMDSLLWLEHYLLGASSALLLVSHDRVFLNNVVNRIVEVERGLTNNFVGNYEYYLEEKEKRQITEKAAYDSQQDKIKQVERFIERNRVRASTARRAQARIKMLDKMEKMEAPVQVNQNFKFSLPTAPRGPEYLVELKNITKTYGSTMVYDGLDFTLRRGDRIAFLGANGQGKSTLMKLMAGVTDFQGGERRQGDGVILSYFAQFQLEELNPNRTVIEELETVAGDLTQGRLRSILGSFLFIGDDVFKKVAVLSGGEKSRLILAKIMQIGPNLLLLDEPSNHLDIPARNMLEQALKDYTGTLCLISHDRHLINSVCDQVLTIGDGRVDVFPGNFDDYQRLWKDRGAGPTGETRKTDQGDTSGDAEPVKPISETRAEKEARKKAQARLRQKLYAQRAPLEAEIERLEKQQTEIGHRIDDISNALADPATYQDAQRSKELTQEHARLKAEMNQVVTAWEAAALKMEEIEEMVNGEEPE